MAIPVTVDIDAAMKAKLAQYLDHLEASVRQGGEFVAKEAPEVVNQMVAYNLGMAIVWCVLGLVLWLLAFLLILWAAKAKEQPKGDEVDGLIFLFLVLLAGGGLAIALNVATLLKCWIAPKYFILEQIIGLVK